MAIKARTLGRSPAYPFISVGKALEQVQALYTREGEYSVPQSSAFTAWGYGAKSSGGRQTLAALKYYGLIEVTGDGEDRKVRVSDTARRILLDKREDNSERNALVKEVALSPAIHKTLYDHYPNGLASDGSVHHFLVFEKGYKSEAATDLLRQFKQTASYAGLFDDASVQSSALDQDSGRDEVQIAAGDHIQWYNDGVDQFREPALVLGISDDGKWVFCDQGAAGIPIEEVAKVAAPAESGAPAVPQHLQRQASVTNSVAPLNSVDDGRSNVLVSGRLKSGQFEVRVSGEVSSLDIRKIISLLEAQSAILDDEIS